MQNSFMYTYTMDAYVCGTVCLCMHYVAYCSNIYYSNLPVDITYVYVQNILVDAKDNGSIDDAYINHQANHGDSTTISNQKTSVSPITITNMNTLFHDVTTTSNATFLDTNSSYFDEHIYKLRSFLV